MSEAKAPLDKGQRLEKLFFNQAKLCLTTAGFFMVGNTLLLTAFASARGGWLKLFLGIFGLILSVAWLVVGANFNLGLTFAQRGLSEWENNLPGSERVYLTMGRQRESLKSFQKVFSAWELILQVLPVVAGIFWIILIIFRPA